MQDPPIIGTVKSSQDPIRRLAKSGAHGSVGHEIRMLMNGELSPRCICGEQGAEREVDKRGGFGVALALVGMMDKLTRHKDLSADCRRR